MVKFANELVPGDVISFGLGGPQMIVAVKPVNDGLAIICDCGEKAVVSYDCKMYVYYNRDEELTRAAEMQCRQVEAERRRHEQLTQARARRNRELLAQTQDHSIWGSVYDPVSY